MNNNTDNHVEYALIVMVLLFFILASMLLSSCSGAKGDAGVAGLRGDIGPQGPAISIITTPASLLECPTGGTDILVGSNLFTICDGSTGAPGTPGANPTPIVFEQVCAGITPSYPASFPEYIMNVGGQVYGVYSANSGFLALLPPGVYSSNGINASCTFTVNTDGTVTQ